VLQIILLAMGMIGFAFTGLPVDGPALEICAFLAWLFLSYWIETGRIFEQTGWFMPIVAVILTVGSLGLFVFLVRRAAE
jgi:hypothetical protein